MISPARISGGASRSTVPSRDTAGVGECSRRQPNGSSALDTAANASALSVCTGPPWNSTDGPVTRESQEGSTCVTLMSLGRFSTTPSVPPSSSCSRISTTLRLKLGSSSSGVATSSAPT